MVRDRVREHAASLGVGLLATALLLVLVDLTGQGTHACWAGRRHLGRALADAVGREKRYSVATVGRCLLELTRAGLITTRRRWSLDFAEKLTALRELSTELLDAIREKARQRSKRRRGPAEEAPPQPAPYVADDGPAPDAVANVASLRNVKAQLAHGPP